MTLTGHIIGGQIVPDAPAVLPEGAAVRIEVVNAPAEESTSSGSDDSQPTLAEQLRDYLTHAIDLPEDAALNHDHYLYGAPKK